MPNTQKVRLVYYGVKNNKIIIFRCKVIFSFISIMKND